MLTLKHIKKSYSGTGYNVNALDDVSLAFRKSEFVAVLGPSGSGKTTLLNIIGGLDHYTSGDLIINGKSTKNFKDADWDSYRNHSIGFVFQSYNLIPHQSVLANVELALTLSGVSRRERRQRAKKALEQVGLGDQLSKRPNQMSGGQMQRVAIARALVNDPDILLADEPTGALDSATSVQIMDLLKEVSHDRLVIMVTHNPELAETYANRIVRVKDGKLVDDTNPFDGTDEPVDLSKTKKTGMSFFTAFTLSLNNLMTKKARTFLTSFAGSIGIIGIALILALSSGVKAFINEKQEETLASYPVSIEAERTDMSGLITNLMGLRSSGEKHGRDAVYANEVMYDLTNTMNQAETQTNDLKSLKAYFESDECNIGEYTRAIQYTYDIPVNIYAKTEEGKYQKSDIMEVFSAMTDASSATSATSVGSSMSSGFASYDVWGELLTDETGENVSDIFTSQYELVAGTWPKDKSELVLVLDKNNEITDITLHAMGLKTSDDIISDILAAKDGKEVAPKEKSYSYEQIMGISFKVLSGTDYYKDNNGDGIWENMEDNDSAMDVILSEGLELHICGIIRPTEDASATMNASLYYTRALTRYLIDRTAGAAVSKAQQADPETDIFSGLPFSFDEAEPSVEQKAAELKTYFDSLDEKQKAAMYLTVLSTPDEDEMQKQIDATMEQYPDRASLEEMIFSFYKENAGMDEDTLRTFIDKYTEEELRDMVEEQIRVMLTEQQKAKAEAAINAVKATPTPEELEPYKAQIAAKLTDRQTKMGYIISQYTQSTAMPQATVAAYLMTQTDAQIDSMADALVTQAATELFAQYAGMSGGNNDAKVAAAFDAYRAGLDDEALAKLYEACMPPKSSDSTYQDNLKVLGVADASSPATIQLYASTFSDKDEIAAIIDRYNEGKEEDDKITYTDYVALIMSSITLIIDAISYVLIAFVSISLVVSSIMIGIITYISVLERTKEIGILRAIGASKRDISRVFNAETFIEGLISGALGVVVTMLLCIPINLIIRHLTGIPTLTAYLPWIGALLLMLVSILLTLIAGLFPSRIAARKDPVEALRTE